MKFAPSVSLSSTSALMALVMASISPTSWLSNLGQRMPGVSSRSSPRSMLIHCLPRVTPGLSPAMAAFRPATLLMKLDFPTFEMPRIITRSGRPACPLASYSRSLSASSLRTAGTKSFTPLPLFASVSRTARPCSSKTLRHAAVACGSARSVRFRITRRGLFPASLSISGLRLERGMRASRISQTASTCLIFSSIIRWALVI